MLPEHLLGRTLKHHLATLASCLRADVHDIVGCQHHVGVVLDHHYRVADVAQLFQRLYQLAVVTLVKAYARLVKDVEHIDELRAYLCGKPYALALTTGERGARTVERQIAQPYLQQEVDTRPQLLQYLVAYLLLCGTKMVRQLVEPFPEVDEVEVRQLGYILVPYPVCQRLLAQTLAVTFGTLGDSQELICPLLSRRCVVVLHYGTQIFHHAIVGNEIVA